MMSNFGIPHFYGSAVKEEWGAEEIPSNNNLLWAELDIWTNSNS